MASRSCPGFAAVLLLAVVLSALSAVTPVHSSAAFSADRLGDPKLPVALAAVDAALRQAQFDVAIGQYELAARRLFSPIAIVSVPGRPLQRLETLAEKAAFLESLAPAPAPPPSADLASADGAFSAEDGISPVVAASSIERAELYVPKFDRYYGYSLLTYGRLLQASGQSAEPRTGKFVLLWDVVSDNGMAGGGGDGGSSDSVYSWGLSWAFWNDDNHTRHAPPPSSPPSRQPHPPRPPHPHPPHSPPPPPASAPSPSPSPAALSAADATLRGVRAALENGRQSTDDQQQQQHLRLPSLPGPVVDPHVADLKQQLHEAWAAFSLNLAAADVAAAASIFADNVTLLPPGHPQHNLTGPLEQQAFLQRLVNCHVALEVTIDSLILVKLKAALTPAAPPSAPEAVSFQEASSAMLRGSGAFEGVANSEEANNGALSGNPLSVITRSSFILTNSSTGKQVKAGSLLQKWTRVNLPDPKAGPQGLSVAASRHRWYFEWGIWNYHKIPATTAAE